jgi:phosphoribosylglycinamide formyltransferase-1
MNVVVLVSGRGGNLRALVEAIAQGSCAANIVAVISDRDAAPALEFAAERGLRTAVVRAKDYADREAWDRELARVITEFAPQLVVLAGFMRLVGEAMLGAFGDRLINVHPALLPAFPGMDAPAQAIAKGVCLSGCTVHLVDAGVDSGPIIAQAAVPVLPGDDAATLHARIQSAEHRLLPAVVHAIGSGELALSPRPHFTGALPESLLSFVFPPVVR